MKFAHIADTHIRNLSYHEEYKAIFNRIFDILIEQKVDYIIHCGDIAHTKTQISPEFVEMCSWLLKRLADIAPTFIILGNHDGNLRNSNRQDAISPIVNALQHPNLHLLKHSGETILNDQFTLNVLSVFDRDNWVEPSNLDKINIALYHGSISGVDTDMGWTMTQGEDSIDIFAKFDFGMLGDIHKTNQILDHDGRVRYPGSTIQQNHGETNDKGFLLWDIESKEKFTCKHFQIPNPKPFVSLVLESDGSIKQDTIIPSNARLRVIAESSLPIETIRKSLDVAKSKFKPESIAFLNKADSKSASVSIDEDFQKEDLRSVAVQEKLMKEYLKDYTITDELYQKIFEINKKYNQIIESKEPSVRNVDYEVLEFEWDNLFNYGTSNRIDFRNLHGVVGIFGKNFSGKSSIIDGFLYTVFNSITKNSRKKTKIINKDCQSGSGKVLLKVGNKHYTVSRQSEKYIKRLHGVETVEAKTLLDFSVTDLVTGEIESLNGVDRIETDKNVGKYFGSFDDFLVTSMSSQLGALSYIEKGSTERKEILAKFLDVDLFSEKFEMANKESAEIKAVIKKLEGKHFEKEITDAEIKLMSNNNAISKCELRCVDLRNQISTLEQEVFALKQEVDSSPEELIDIDDVLEQIKKKNDEISSLQKTMKEIETKNSENDAKIKKVDEFVEKFDVKSLQEKQEIIEEHEQKLNALEREMKDTQKDLSHEEKKLVILKEVPCGPEYSHCKFIKGAYEAQEQVNLLKMVLAQHQGDGFTLRQTVKKLDPDKVKEQLEKYAVLLKKRETFARDNTSLKSQLEIKLQLSKVAELEIARLHSQQKKYEENKEKIDRIEGLVETLQTKEKNLKKLKSEFQSCDNDLKDLYKNKGFTEQKIEKLKEEQTELDTMRKDYEAYDLFMKCMHPSGISYDIIKNSLPNINNEISKVLSNIVDFQVYFENEDNRLELYMKRQNETEALPIEMGSGAQKNIAAMAIRLAFINVSSLPKSDIFVLDEPGTSLDEDNMEGFIRMLDVIKSQFKCVILISHLDSLKDTADTIINIDQKDGFAYVNV